MAKEYNLFSLVARDKDKPPDDEIPERVELKAKQMWCPYCSTPVVFVKDKKLGVKRCPICGISDRDYHVKRLNSRWK